MAVCSLQLAEKKTFRDLIVYQKSKRLVKQVYALANKFPRNQFALQNQVQKAAISVPANIAEGQQRFSKKEFIRFLYTGRASLAEVEVYVDIAKDLKYINQKEFEQAQLLIEEVGKLINGLISSSKYENQEPATEN